MDSFTIGNSLSKLSLLETWHPRTDEDLASISSERLAPGERLLECYTVESDALKGGMGSVWRVRYDALDKPLAMKRPQPRFFAEASVEVKERFIHECEAWIGLGLHPNIVACYYVRDIGGVPSIFAEWMEGGSLEKRIRDGILYEGTPAQQQERLLRIALQFARGLRYAHDRGLVHQDVKPDNVLLTADMKARVSDFGLSGAYGALGTVGSGAYTPAYCSPEQARGEPVDIRTDIYSWAVSVMEMYTGGCRWSHGEDAGARCSEYFSNCRVEPPEKLVELLSLCMCSEASKRPSDFAGVEDSLRDIYRATCGADYDDGDDVAASDSADSLNNQAVSYMEIGMADSAVSCWDEAWDIDPTHVEALYNRALIAWRSGERNDMEVWRQLLSHPFFMRTEAGRQAVDAVVREAGKIEMDASLFTDEEERTLDSEIGLWHGRAYAPEKSEDGFILKVMDAETGALIETIDLSDAASQAEGKIVRAFMSEDCAQVGLVTTEDCILVFDIETRRVMRNVQLVKTGMYDSGINYMLMGENARFLRRMVSHGMGHAAPTPETYDLATGERIRQGIPTYADWQLIQAGADAPLGAPNWADYPYTICDGLRAVPIRGRDTPMACDTSGRPEVALPRALARELADIRREMPGEGVRRIADNGIVWFEGSEGLMQFDLASGKCLRSYGLPSRYFVNLYLDEHGEGVIWRKGGGMNEKRVWMYRRLLPVREEDRAEWLISALESFEEYRDRTRRLDSLFGDFTRADAAKDLVRMCGIYGEASGIRRFFGSANQQTMLERLNAVCRQCDSYMLLLSNGELGSDMRDAILAPFGLNGDESARLKPAAAPQKPLSVNWEGGDYAFNDAAERWAFTHQFPDSFRVLDADELHGLIAVVARRGKGVIDYNFRVWSVDERRFLLDLPLSGYHQDKWILARFGVTKDAQAQMLLAVRGIEPSPTLKSPPYSIYQFSCEYEPEPMRRAAPKPRQAEPPAIGGDTGVDAVQKLHDAYRNSAATAAARPQDRSCQRRRDDMARRLKEAFLQMGKALDVGALSHWYEEYRALSDARPGAEGFAPIRDFVQSQLAFALSRQDAPVDRLRALCLYDELAVLYPERELYARNVAVLANPLIVQIERLGTAHDAKALEHIYEVVRSRRAALPGVEAAAPVYTSAQSQYAFALSRQEDDECRLTALGLYDELSGQYPDRELYRKNAKVITNQLLVAFDRMAASFDEAGLERWHARSREFMQAHPGSEFAGRLFDGADTQLAFVLSRREDIASKERALEMYEDLSRRHPEEPTYTRNSGVLQGQLFRLRREQRKEERRQARSEGKGGLFSIFKRK